MKAAIMRTVGGDFEISEVSIAEPLGHEVLIDVRASGLCHSDITVAKTGAMGFDFPILLGHEIAGVVAAVGSAVSRFKVGDHVVAAALQPCGLCRNCMRGKVWACTNPGTLERDKGASPRLYDASGPIGQQVGLGGFAEQTIIHENQLVAIDPAMPFEQAAVIGCAVATGAGNIFNVAKVQPGDSVAVFGCGGVGLNAIQAATLAGATEIVGIDIQPANLELAKKFGATAVIDSTQTDVSQKVSELTNSEGIDHAFVMVGVPAVTEAAFNILGRGGTVYLVGLMPEGAEMNLRTAPTESSLQPHQQGVRGSWLGSSNFYHDIPMYVDLYLQGKLNLDDMVDKTIALDEINEGFESLEGGGARTVIVFPNHS